MIFWTGPDNLIGSGSATLVESMLGGKNFLLVFCRAAFYLQGRVGRVSSGRVFRLIPEAGGSVSTLVMVKNLKFSML